MTLLIINLLLGLFTSVPDVRDWLGNRISVPVFRQEVYNVSQLLACLGRLR